MNEFVKDKDYGASIQHYYIGCICIKEKQGYEDLVQTAQAEVHRK